MTILIILIVWFVISIPIGLFIGQILRLNRRE